MRIFLTRYTNFLTGEATRGLRVLLGGGTGILVHRSIEYDDITPNFTTSVECTFLSFAWEGKTFVFGSVLLYLPQQNSVEIENFLTLLDQVVCADFDILIICGDFNA